jgi:hypothetical protein
MKNKQRREHYRQDAMIYKDYYKPSFNLWRIFKSIFGVLIFGNACVAHSYMPVEKKKQK